MSFDVKHILRTIKTGRLLGFFVYILYLQHEVNCHKRPEFKFTG
jgi:hypothetical protein